MKLEEAPSPALGAGQIRIGVKSAGVNFADLMMRMGLYPEAPKPPFTPGYEVAGEVLESNAAGFAKGDRVLAASKFGGYVSEICVEVPQTRKLPAGISFDDAASIPVN